jgi:hypothetical protein
LIGKTLSGTHDLFRITPAVDGGHHSFPGRYSRLLPDRYGTRRPGPALALSPDYRLYVERSHGR